MGRIVKRKLSDSVLDEIRRMIDAGELKEGDKLPNQHEFAAQLGVSRVSLREALHTLALLGVIEQHPGSGTVVRRPMPPMLTDRLSPPLMSDPERNLELVEARRYLEVGCAELAAQNATDEEVAALGALVAEMTAALRDGRLEEYSHVDLRFHALVAEASHNRLIAHLFLTIQRQVEQFIDESFIVLPGMYERSLAAHRSVYEAIRDRDAKRAGRAMSKHVLDVQRALERYTRVTRKENGNGNTAARRAQP